MDTFFNVFLGIISCALIVIIMLQESTEDATNAFTGEKSELFANKKERGIEVWIKRITAGLAICFFVLAIVCAFFVNK